MREDTVNALLRSLPNHMTSPAVLAYFDGAVSCMLPEDGGEHGMQTSSQELRVCLCEGLQSPDI
jgi:hypothetical protein